MNDLEKFFYSNTGKMMHKWNHYFSIYDYHFSRFKNTGVNILEFGVSHGGSLQMWKDYFGPKAKIYGVDLNSHCKKLEEENIEIHIADQNNLESLKELSLKLPKVDILIDDGGHMMDHQLNTFKVFFNQVNENGIYLCEDTHTSYWKKFGGGYKDNQSFIEYTKNIIDYLHAFHSESEELKPSEFTRNLNSIHFYDSVVVLEKKIRDKPKTVKSGNRTLPFLSAQYPSMSKFGL